MKNDEPIKISRTVTADDVAEAAGVSRWTVARAFKKGASISAKNREKILSVAEDLGYAPDLLASSLASDRSNLVGLLVDDFSNPHKLVLLEILTEVLQEAGWGTLLINTLGKEGAAAALLNARQRRVDAAVLIGSLIDENILESVKSARSLKQLVVFARASSNPDMISLSCDDAQAMREITEHVKTQGYKCPLFLAGPKTEPTRLVRKETFLSFWDCDEGRAKPTVAHALKYEFNEARRAVIAALKDQAPRKRPDVIVCENDILAFGAADAIRYHFGLRIPEDIAITGYDDIPMASSPNYDLTTYRPPIREMARTLVSMLESGDPAVGPKLFHGELIKRGSC